MENKVNKMAVGFLATYVTKLSVAMVMIMQDKLVIVFPQEGLQ